MTIRRDGSTIRLLGNCFVEDAEELSALLTQPGQWEIDLAQCESVHAAVVQALLVFKPALRGAAGTDFVGELLLPALRNPLL
jgi:hypothetical protein